MRKLAADAVEDAKMDNEARKKQIAEDRARKERQRQEDKENKRQWRETLSRKRMADTAHQQKLNALQARTRAIEGSRKQTQDDDEKWKAQIEKALQTKTLRQSSATGSYPKALPKISSPTPTAVQSNRSPADPEQRRMELEEIR